MKTLYMTQEQMQSRLARYASLKPLEIQTNPKIPLEARDLVYARKLLSVVGLDEKTESPISSRAPISGAGGMTITLAVCPPGQGPGLHTHHNTFETFTVLSGRWEFSWNDDGSGRAVLEPFDTISVPPGINRGFRNIGSEEGVLQVIITGGVHDLNDIASTPEIAAKLDATGPGVLAEFQKVGLKFDSGVVS